MKGSKIRNRPSYRSARKRWFEENPPNKYGYYDCAVCGFWVYKDLVSIDHIKDIQYRPELFNDIRNFQPTHHKCNIWKSYNKKVPFTRPDNFEELKQKQVEQIISRQITK